MMVLISYDLKIKGLGIFPAQNYSEVFDCQDILKSTTTAYSRSKQTGNCNSNTTRAK